MPPARRDPTAVLALRAVERDERPVRLAGPMVDAMREALQRPIASLKVADLVFRCLQSGDA